MIGKRPKAKGKREKKQRSEKRRARDVKSVFRKELSAEHNTYQEHQIELACPELVSE